MPNGIADSELRKFDRVKLWSIIQHQYIWTLKVAGCLSQFSHSSFCRDRLHVVDFWSFGEGISDHQELFLVYRTGEIHMHSRPRICWCSPTLRFLLPRGFDSSHTCGTSRNILFDLSINIRPVYIATCKCFHPWYH